MLQLNAAQLAYKEVKYEAEYELWQFTRDIIAPALGVGISNGTLMYYRPKTGDVWWNFHNKHLKLKDVIADGGVIECNFTLRKPAEWRGNACPQGNAEADDVCGICLDPLRSQQFGMSNLVSLPCFHFFHDACLSRWCDPMRDHPKCPTCRGEWAFL